VVASILTWTDQRREQRASAIEEAMKTFLVLGLLGTMLLPLSAASAADATCDPVEPDSLQVSWTAPCEDGTWLFDPENGCRMWDWHPAPEDTVTWTGACRAGVKEGKGSAQWYEHGRPIDRFDGTYRNGRRSGFGRYRWTPSETFQGQYAGGLPHGQGTIEIAGKSYTGRWNHGCLEVEGEVIAIGTSIASCGGRAGTEVVATAPAPSRERRQ
jgi:hypothetical protein